MGRPAGLHAEALDRGIPGPEPHLARRSLQHLDQRTYRRVSDRSLRRNRIDQHLTSLRVTVVGNGFLKDATINFTDASAGSPTA